MRMRIRTRKMVMGGDEARNGDVMRRIESWSPPKRRSEGDDDMFTTRPHTEHTLLTIIFQPEGTRG